MADFFSANEALRFKPVHWFVCKILYSIFGPDPAAWHGLGLVCHAIASALLFVIGRKGLRMAMPEASASAVGWVAWGAAALWALHPLRVEPVAWVTGSSYPLATCFVFGSFGAYLKFSDTPGDHGLKWLILSWGLAVLAYGSYPTTVSYAGWLLAVDCFLVKRAPSDFWRWSDSSVRRWWLKHAAFVFPAVAAVLATVVSRVLTPGIFGAAPTLQDTTVWERICGAAAAAGYLIGRPLGPWRFTPDRFRYEEGLHAIMPG